MNGLGMDRSTLVRAGRMCFVADLLWQRGLRGLQLLHQFLHFLCDGGGRERLNHVRNDIVPHRLCYGLARASPGAEHDWQSLDFGVLPDSGEKCQAVYTRHSEVKDQEIELPIGIG